MSENLLNVIDYNHVLTSNCSYFDISSDLLGPVEGHNALTVAHLNIHSLPGKFDELVELLNELETKNILPDIILLCETFLTEANHSRYHFDKYDIVSKFRKNKRGGGVSILVNSQITYVDRSDLVVFEEGMFESIFIEVKQSSNDSIIIGEIYRVPGTREAIFLENYEGILEKIRSERKKVIIGTDQNMDYLKINSHGNTMKLFETNLEKNVIPTIYKPTRVTHNSATLIDNIYVDAELYNNCRSLIITGDISDHYMCLAILQNLYKRDDNVQQYKFRKIDDTVLRNMTASLRNRNWMELNNMTVNESSEKLTSEIKKVMDFYAPEKTMSVKKSESKSCQPWLTKGLKRSAQKCHQMYRTVARKDRNSIDFQNYRTYRNTLNSLRRKAKFDYYKELIQENRCNSKKIWAIIHKLVGKLKNKKEISDEILVNGSKESRSDVVGKAFAKHYSEIGKQLADKIDEKGNIKDPMINMRSRVEQICFFFPTTTREIENIVRKLKAKDSCGIDGISNRILKKIYPGIIEAMKIIFDKSMQEGIFPSNMKIAIVKPLYKGKSKTEIINYRPVSLLPVISKVLEKVIQTRVVNFFVKHKVLTEGQYGFRQGRSTNDAILDFAGNVLENMNKGFYTLSLFLDMSKAFDSIKHDTLFKKLEFYGIRGKALSWFKSYLTDRQIQVKYKNVLSESSFMSYGTPQGSVLGPLMYIVLANDISKCLKFCSCVTFADDTTVFAAGSNLKFLFKKVNADLERLGDWFDSNSLTLNVDKSKFIVFRNRGKALLHNGSIRLAGKELERVNKIKFLGVTIDEFLDWKYQVKNVLTKLIAGNYSLRMVKHMLPTPVKVQIYHANIHSHLNYALNVWGPMIKMKDLNDIKKQQNKAIRAIFNLGPRIRLLPFYKRAEILTIEDAIQLSLAKISFRYVNDILPVRITNLFDVIEHDYMTRNRNVLRVPHHTLALYNQSYLGKAPNVWLNLNNNLRNKNNINTFSKNFVRCKISEY